MNARGPTPNLTKPLRRHQTEGQGLQKPTLTSATDSFASSSGPANFLRSAFRALARPVRIRRSYDGLKPVELADNQSTPSLEYYSVDERDRRTYQSYLNSLAPLELVGRAIVSEMEGSSVTHSRLISELEDTSNLALQRQKEQDQAGAGAQNSASTPPTRSRFMATPSNVKATDLTGPAIKRFVGGRPS